MFTLFTNALVQGEPEKLIAVYDANTKIIIFFAKKYNLVINHVASIL